MAPSPYTTTYTAFGKTYSYTYNYPTSTYSYGGYDGADALGAAISGTLIFIVVVIGLQVLSLITVVIVHFVRQARRKAWYGPMAEHYRNGGLPPWVVVGDGSGKAPLPIDYTTSYVPHNSYSVAPVQNEYPNSYPPTPHQPQYEPAVSTPSAYEAPPQQYKGY